MRSLISFTFSQNPIDTLTVYKDGSLEVKTEDKHLHFGSMLDFERSTGFPMEEMYSRLTVKNIKRLLKFELYQCPLGDFYEKRGDIFVRVGEFKPCLPPRRCKKVSFDLHPYKE